MPIIPNVRFALPLDTMGVLQTVRVAGSGAEKLMDQLSWSWSWCTAESPARSAHDVRVFLDDDEGAVARAQRKGMVADTDAFRLSHRLTPMLTMEAINQLAGKLLMLHAAVVCDPTTGAAAVMVGPSGRGKTTLAVQLGQQLGYVTDETAAIERDLTIRAFPKPLSVVTPDRSEKDQVGPDQLGLLQPGVEPRATALFLLDRRPDAPATSTAATMPKLAAIAALAEQSSYLKRIERPLHRLADLVDSCGGLQLLSYRDGADLAPLVRQHLDGAAS